MRAVMQQQSPDNYRLEGRMNFEIGISERRFRNWHATQSREELDFGIIVPNIWRMLASELSEHDLEEGFHYLICFIQRVRKKQNRLIQSLCSELGFAYWDTLVERSSCLFEKLKPQSEILNEKRGKLPEDEYWHYLHRVLEYSLIDCNRRMFTELAGPQERQIDPYTLRPRNPAQGERSSSRGLTTGRYRSLEELIRDIMVREKAGEIHARLRSELSAAHLNVLCHYYETLANQDTQRLMSESKDNIHQLHRRLRNELRGFFEYAGYDAEEIRLFFKLHMPELCQSTPVSRTYRIDMGDIE